MIFGITNEHFAFVCFTRKADESLLPLHYSAIQTVLPGVPVRYAVDVSDAEMAIPQGAEMVVTEWKRNGNLRGFEALRGIVATLAQMAVDYPNARAIVKIDSDVCFMGAEWLQPLVSEETGMIGISPGGVFCASGACYGVSPRRLVEIAEFLASEIYFDLMDSRAEDATLSFIAAIVGKPYSVTIAQSYYPNLDLYFSCAFDSRMFSDLHLLDKVTGFVDCGSVGYFGKYLDEQASNIAAVKRRAMAQCLEYLKANNAKR
jgi:hypothetical protein